MANGGSIKYNIGFNVDKTGLNQLKSSLQEIKAMTATDLMKIGGHNDIEKANNDLKELQKSIQLIDGALERAFNTDLGTLNVAKFNQELSKMNLNKVYGDFKNAGAAGQAAFRNTTAQILTTNMQLKQTHSLLDNMATTMANTIKWGAASSVMNTFTGSVQKAYGYVKNLDTSLNDIMIVTGKNADEMERFAVQANNAAKSLGQSTTNYTEASLIYYQQGLSDEEVKARAETTLKAANVTGQTGAEVSEQLTAVWNGYKVSAEEAELYVDKLAAVAATTAADLEELSVGMSKVASAANLMGVDVDQLNAQLATIVSVTRQAPESVGTALKTIYARMGDIEAGLDSEVSLGDYTEKMAAMGVNVLDMNGELRDMGEVIEEIGGKWTSMSREQQVYLSQVMAGTRQYNNLLSLFDNWDMYTSALDTSENSMGTLQEQQDIYMESTAAHSATLKATWEDLYDSLLDPKSINTVVDGLTTVVDLLGNFVDSIGGGIGVLTLLGSVGMQVFGKQIASGLATTIINMQAAKQNTQQLQAEMEILNQFENANIDDARTQRLIKMKRQQLDLTKSLAAEERNISNEYINQQNELYKEQDIIEENLRLAAEQYSKITGDKVNLTTSVDKDTGKVSIANQEEVSSKLKSTGEGFISEANKLKDVSSVFDQMTAAAANYRKEMELGRGKTKEAQENAITVWTETNDIIIENIQAARRLADSDKVSAKNKEELNRLLKEWNSLTKNRTDVDLTNIKVAELAQKIQKERLKTLKNQGQEFINSSKAVDQSSQALENNNAKVETLTQRWNNFIKQIDLRNNIMQFTTLIGKIGQIASGINSLKQIPSIFNNEDLSTGEKFLQIISSLSMGLPMLVNGIMGSIETFNKLRTSINNNLLMTSLYNNAVLKTIGIEKAKNAQEALNLVLQEAGIKLTKEEIANLTVAEARQLIKNALDKGEIQNLTGIQAATRLNIIAREQENKTISKTILLKMKELALNPMFWVAAAGIAAVTAAVWLSVKAQNASKEAMEKANKELEKQQESYRKIKEEYDALKSTLENYSNSKKAIEEMTAGTIEWKEAVQELNQEVINLMQTYPELAKYVSNEGGILTISQAGQDFITEQKFNETQIAYRSQLLAQEKANAATKTYKLEQAGKSIAVEYEQQQVASYISGSAPTGAQTYYAPGKELYQETVTGTVSSEDVLKVVEAMQENSALLGDQNQMADTLYGKSFSELTAAEKATVKALQENDDALNALSTELQGMEIAEEMAKQQALVSAMEGEEVFEGVDNATLQTIARINQEEIKVATEENKAQYEGLSAEELASYFGYSVAGGYSFKEEDGQITVSKGEDEILTIVRDAAVESLAQQQAVNEFFTEEVANANIETIQNMEKKADSLSKGLGQYLATFAGGNAGSFTGASGAQVQDFMDQLDSSYFIKNNYKLYGFENEEAFRAEIEEAARQYWESYNGIVNAQGLKASAEEASNIQGIISKGSVEDLDEEQRSHLNSLEKKYIELGEIQDRNSHEYLAKLREVIELEEEAAKKELEIQRERDEADAEYYANEIKRVQNEIAKAEAMKDEDTANELRIQLEADVTAFEEAMQNLQDYYAEMKVQIKADFQSDIDSAFGLADEIGKLQDLVQDDLTVTFEEAQELINQGYAEILRNSQETNEQTILLDKATKNSFIDSRQQELEASRQAKLADIEMQRAVLLEQEAALQTEIDAYTAAANSKSAISAAEALNDAKNAHATYESKVLEYNDLLSKSSDTASEEEGINEELYNSLSQMYTDDSLNQQNAEQSATDTQKSNIENRIANVHQLHAAYRALGQQILATEQNPGQAVALGGTGALEGGVSIETPEIISVEGTGDYGYEEVTAKDLEQFFTGDEANTEFKATMEAMAEKAAAEQKVVRERLSALDAAEAALKSADISLDKAQADAKKGGSKSGSGSSDKEKDPDYMESLNEERDIYHDINYELEKINDKIAKQERLTSKLTGKQRIDALEKEIELLKEQADLEETKLAMLQNEQATLRDKLSKDEDTTVAFDAEGDIANYNEALAQKEAAVNAIIARYNAMSAEEQEAFKSTVEAAKEEYEQFKEDMERYEEIITQDIVESQDNINNLLDQQIEKQIEQFELEIELKIDTREAERQFQDFIKNHVKNIDDEDYAGLAQFSLDQIKTYTGAGGDLNTYETAMNAALSDYNKIMAGGTGSVYGDDATAALEAYEKYRDLVYDTYGEIGDLIDEVRDAELDGIDAANDKFDEQLEKYDQIEDSLNRRLELSQLLSGEEDYETQLKYQEQMKQNNLERQQLLQQEIATYEKHLAYLEVSGRGNSEAAESLAEKLQEAQEQLAETTAESLELIAESYETKKKQLIQDMNTEVTGGLGLDYINQEWELINENADMYLDTINSAFELSQLESKMLDAIDNTEGLAAQERLNSLMDEELGKLREKEKLTQYDVDRANKLFDIELKRIALEEAQASKTQMRLRRDSQGNYTYQYVADQNKVAEAERELAEAENELYNMDKDAYKDNLDELKSAYEEYIDEVNELSILYKDNQEEFYRQLALLTEKYGERIGGLTDQNIDIGFNLQGSALAEVAKMTGANIEDLENMSQEDIDSLMATIVPQWSSGVAEMVTKLANGGFGEMANEIANMFIQLQKDQQEEMENAAAAGGESLDEIASGADIVSQKFGEIDTETQEIVTSLDTMLISLSQNVTAAEKFADNLKEAAEASANIISQGNAAIYGTEDFVSLGATDGLSASSIAKTEVAKRVDSIDTELVRLHGGVDNSVSPAMEEALKIVQVAQKVETLKSLQSPKTNTISSYQAAFEQMQQKQDVITLSPIKSIESFIENLQSSISQRAFQLENQLLFDKLDKLISEQEAEKLEQMVHITADFPGVSSTAEIEEAFNNLINAASQYAFRTERK